MSDSPMKIDKVQAESDYQWLIMQSLSQYKGQWIAVLEKKIIARNQSLKEVKKEIKARKLEIAPLILRVPEGMITV